jgi:hypothetical protein
LKRRSADKPMNSELPNSSGNGYGVGEQASRDQLQSGPGSRMANDSNFLIYENAPRTRLMRQIGYQFHPLAAKENPNLSCKSKCFFCRLDLTKDGKEAVTYLRHSPEPC